MNINHEESAQELDADKLAALAEADEATAVEPLTPKRVNSKYALLQDGTDA